MDNIGANYFSDPNEAVLTTSLILYEKDPITIVYHHLEDGIWEFGGKIAVNESNCRVVSMEEMLKLDNSLLSLSNMEPGYLAYRISGKNIFVIEKNTTDI